MDTALTVVTLMACVIAITSLARRVGVPAPLVLVVFGFVGSYVPHFPAIELTPTLILIGLLPPLLYAAAIRTSLVDFRANKRPILLLSVGLVIFTTVLVGLLAYALLPIDLSLAFALGAVVAPPDAVAATAIARRVGMPRRVVTILEGESLVNDATALVCLRTAIAATLGSVSVWGVGWDFVVSAVGGILIGVVTYAVVGWIRTRITDDLTDVAVTLITPWIAYLPAEEINASGVLAVVVAGLLLGHRSPAIQSASSRIFERTNWATISFVLENMVFLLIGLQVRAVVTALGASTLSPSRIVGVAAAILVAVIVLRIVWVFPSTYLPRLVPAIARDDPAPDWRATFLVSWAGMRGVVTLAAVFLIPGDTEYREVLVAIAFAVTAGTLLIQGTTLAPLVKWLKIPGPDIQEDHLQEATVYQRAATAGLAELDRLLTGEEPPEVIERLRNRSHDRSNAVWERLGATTETPNVVYTRLRERMLQAERAEVLRIRDTVLVSEEVLQHVMDTLDVEETILDRIHDSSTADREHLLVPSVRQGACEHIQVDAPLPTPRTPDGCAECLRDGTDWVHLRLCMTCGHVGCCDSSVGRHATRHVEEDHHPVIRSFEPGEAWQWCYIDEVAG